MLQLTNKSFSNKTSLSFSSYNKKISSCLLFEKFIKNEMGLYYLYYLYKSQYCKLLSIIISDQIIGYLFTSYGYCLCAYMGISSKFAITINYVMKIPSNYTYIYQGNWGPTKDLQKCLIPFT